MVYIDYFQEVLGERVKAFLAWQNAVNTLHKKREQRSRLELGGRLDKVCSDDLMRAWCYVNPFIDGKHNRGGH